MWRNFASNLLTIMIVLLVVVVGLIGWGQQQYVAEGPLAEPICLEVPRGSSMASVADRLVAQGAMVTDLDGPLLLAEDRETPLTFDAAGVHPPAKELWG